MRCGRPATGFTTGFAGAETDDGLGRSPGCAGGEGVECGICLKDKIHGTARWAEMREKR